LSRTNFRRIIYIDIAPEIFIDGVIWVDGGMPKALKLLGGKPKAGDPTTQNKIRPEIVYTTGALILNNKSATELFIIPRRFGVRT